MGKLIYVTNLTLDGYIEDENGDFNLIAPNDDVFAAATDAIRAAGTLLYGRRLYEAMAVWETEPALAAQSEAYGEFATAWQAATKIVYSTTLETVPTADTRVEREFDPEAVRRIKAETAEDLTVGGADLAEQAFRAGLVDECLLFVMPVIVGGGKPGLPSETRASLDLLDARRFDNGVMLLRYATLS
jgi:dihydrofolate reductase